MAAILGMFWNVPQIELERLKTKKSVPQEKPGLMGRCVHDKNTELLVTAGKDRPPWAPWDS